MQRANSGTKVGWFTSPSPDPEINFFQGVYWVFGPAIEAFKHCRPVLEIDGTYLFGRYKGKLLVACGFDAEDQLVPLAFALFDEERNETWERFMKFIRREVVGRRVVMVLSDRHKSILRLFDEPNLGWNTRERQCFNRYCSRHICQNFTTEFKNKKLTNILRAACRQNQKHKFLRRMGRIREKCADALTWFEDIGRRTNDHDREDAPRFDLWVKSFDEGGRRFRMMTTNGPESLNNVFKEARELPVTSIVEVTFYKSVKYFAERRAKSEKAIQEGHIISPKIQAILEKRRLRGNSHIVTAFRNENKYEVITGIRYDGNKRKGGNKHTVWISRPPGACTCQKPQLTGIPCSHILACCATSNISSNSYVAQFYSSGHLLRTWAAECRDQN